VGRIAPAVGTFCRHGSSLPVVEHKDSQCGKFYVVPVVESIAAPESESDRYR
jgi:hypothetical protein